jgi:hypothetical protein
MNADELMTYRDIARWTGLTEVNLRNRLAQGRMPTPDGRVGEKPYWMETTIRRWAPNGHPDKRMRADAGGRVFGVLH